MPQLNAYLTRLCWLLRQGEPVADVAVYLPNEALFAAMGTATGGSLDTWREAGRRIPRAVPATIRAAGFDYDLIDDEALAITPADRYHAVVVPATAAIPDGTATWLDQVMAAGGSVIMVDSSAQVPGAAAVPADALAGALTAAVDPDLVMTPPTPDIGFVHRRCRDADVYVLANTGPSTARSGSSREGTWPATPSGMPPPDRCGEPRPALPDTPSRCIRTRPR